MILPVGEFLFASDLCVDGAVLVGDFGTGIAFCDEGPTTRYLDDDFVESDFAFGLKECVVDEFCPLQVVVDNVDFLGLFIFGTPVEVDGEPKARPGETVFFECFDDAEPRVPVATDVFTGERFLREVGQCSDRSVLAAGEILECVPAAEFFGEEEAALDDIFEEDLLICYVCSCEDVFDLIDECDELLSVGCPGGDLDFSDCEEDVEIPEAGSAEAEATTVSVQATIDVVPESPSADCVSEAELRTANFQIQSSFAARAGVPREAVTVTFDLSGVCVCGQPCSAGRRRRSLLSAVPVDVTVALPTVPVFQEELAAEVRPTPVSADPQLMKLAGGLRPLSGRPISRLRERAGGAPPPCAFPETRIASLRFAWSSGRTGGGAGGPRPPCAFVRWD